MTAYASDEFGRLAEGRASYGACDASAPSFWVFQPTGATTQPFRLSVAAGNAQALTVYVTRCLSGIFQGACVPGPSQPPSSQSVSFAVGAGSRYDLILAPPSAAYCGSSGCVRGCTSLLPNCRPA